MGMRGHEQVIALRLKGVKPAIVFVNDFPCATDWLEHNEHATISIANNTPVHLLDLRCLVGLVVSISSDDEQRAKALAAACKRVGARTVAAAHTICLSPWRVATGWAEIWQQGQPSNAQEASHA